MNGLFLLNVNKIAIESNYITQSLGREIDKNNGKVNKNTHTNTVRIIIIIESKLIKNIINK